MSARSDRWADQNAPVRIIERKCSRNHEGDGRTGFEPDRNGSGAALRYANSRFFTWLRAGVQVCSFNRTRCSALRMGYHFGVGPLTLTPVPLRCSSPLPGLAHRFGSSLPGRSARLLTCAPTAPAASTPLFWIVILQILLHRSPLLVVLLLTGIEAVFFIFKKCYARLLSGSYSGNSQHGASSIPSRDALALSVFGGGGYTHAGVAVCSSASLFARNASPPDRADARPRLRGEGQLIGRACTRRLWVRKSSLTQTKSRHV